MGVLERDDPEVPWDADPEQDIAFSFEGAPRATSCTLRTGATVPLSAPLPPGALLLLPVAASYTAADAANLSAAPAPVA